MVQLYKHIGTPVLFGKGAVQEISTYLKEWNCKTILVIHDKNLRELGLLQHLEKSLSDEAYTLHFYDGVQPDPPDTVIADAAKYAREIRADCMIGFGGGSAIDTVKGVNILMNNDGPIQKFFAQGAKIQPGIKTIFIPTTAGTGSEVTNMLIVTDTTNGNEKRGIISEHCLASLAVVDPMMSMGMPPALTAATGMDALAHAAEAMTCKMANAIVNAMCREAIRMIAENLPIAVKNGADIAAREKMACAATLAGMAFTNVRLHVGHSVGHVLGAKYHIPHGVACAIALPAVIRWAGMYATDAVKEIGTALGCRFEPDASAEQIGLAAAEAVKQLKREIGIPKMRDLGITQADFLELIPLIRAQGAFFARPGDLSDEELAALLEEMYAE